MSPKEINFQKTLAIIGVCLLILSYIATLFIRPLIEIGGLGFLMIYCVGFWQKCNGQSLRFPHNNKKTDSFTSIAILIILISIVGLSVATLVTGLSSPSKIGVPVLNGLPLFASRNHYISYSRNLKFEVNRSEFIFNGLPFMTGWYGMAIFFGTGVLMSSRKKTITKK
ncbi:MAG: hypothetical protein H6753_05730 [Candidatus Omnitrophica bacterium]|nr:hypothetical protein [Candidatus Omnitrophota bacterium]